MDPLQVTAPELPGRQCCWVLTLGCIQHMGNYWARHLPPNITSEFYKRVDMAVQTIVIVSTQLDSSDLDDFTKERMRLPIKCKGMGLRSLFDRRHLEFIGSMIHGIPYLTNRQSDSGLISYGRVHIPSMVTYLGKHSFDGNPDYKPWETLLSHWLSPTAQGLTLAWITLHYGVIDACTIIEDLKAPINLLNNVVQSNDFDFLTHKSTFKSITKRITIEINKPQMHYLPSS